MTILHMTPVDIYPRATTTAIAITFLVGIVLCITIANIAFRYFDSPWIFLGVYLTMIFYALCAIIYFSYSEPSDRYVYEVTIQEDTLFHDIYDKYEVIDQRGEIFTLKEKEKIDE